MLRMGVVAIVFHMDTIGYSCLLLVPILTLMASICMVGIEDSPYTEDIWLVTRYTSVSYLYLGNNLNMLF